MSKYSIDAPVSLWLEAKPLLQGQKAYGGMQEVMLLNNDMYPHAAPQEEFIFNDEGLADTDHLKANNYTEFLKEFRKFIKKLNSLLGDDSQVAFEKARWLLSYYSSKDKTRYYPMVIDFEDGQYLIGLARQYGKEQGTILNRKEKVKVTKWFLNGVDINKVVYKNRSALVDENYTKLAKVIAMLVNSNAQAFAKANPEAHLNTDKELDAEIKQAKEQLVSLQEQIAELQVEQLKEPELVEAPEEVIEEVEEPEPVEEIEEVEEQPTDAPQVTQEADQGEQVANVSQKALENLKKMGAGDDFDEATDALFDELDKLDEQGFSITKDIEKQMNEELDRIAGV